MRDQPKHTSYEAWKEVSRLASKLETNAKIKRRLITKITDAILRADAIEYREFRMPE